MLCSAFRCTSARCRLVRVLSTDRLPATLRPRVPLNFIVDLHAHAGPCWLALFEHLLELQHAAGTVERDPDVGKGLGCPAGQTAIGVTTVKLMTVPLSPRTTSSSVPSWITSMGHRSRGGT